MTWVVLELTPRAEQEDPDVVMASIARSLKVKVVDVYIPTAVTQVGEDRVTQPLYDGYAFAKLCKSSNDYFRLENTKFVQTVLLKTGSGSKHQRISTVTDTDILKMRDQVRQFADQGIGIGDTVKILSGPFRNILAEVIGEIPETDTVQLHVKLRSKQALLTLPRSFLVIEKRAPYSHLMARVKDLLHWTERFSPVFTLPSDVEMSKLSNMGENLLKISYYSDQAVNLNNICNDKPLLQKSGALQRWFTSYHNSASLLKKYTNLNSMVRFCEDSESVPSQLSEGIVKLTWLDSVLCRISNLWLSVDSLQREILLLEKGTKDVVQNLIVDGHNLAFRCMHAMESQKLKDRTGRPTGAVLGFLRSLGMLKKRYPEATIYVTWDGSSQRRKQRYSNYKGNRPKGLVGDNFALIKQLLGSLGVYQVTNPEEEADDVIATLVRGQLKGQSNVIFTTDKDLLQCVDGTTRVLYPSVGSRNEILYDSSEVSESFGVPPNKLVQLRALCGDDSDNIPGVPRVPKKVLKELVKTYGSVAGIFQSSLAELSKGQYDRLRAAQPQVDINLELMALVEVDLTMSTPNVDLDEFVSKLKDLDIDPDPHVSTFFGRSS